MRPAAGRRAAIAAPAVLIAALASAATGIAQTTDAALDGPSVVLSDESGASPYSGVGRYEGRRTCTAFFLDTGPIPDDVADAPAYAVTSGHCAGAGYVIFNFFETSTERQLRVAVARSVYSTMTGRDIAVLELAAHFAELSNRMIRPLRVPFFAHATARDPILVVGAPEWPDRPRSFLRVSSCRIEGVAPTVVERGWTWVDTPFTRCRDLLPGSAGSPVFSVTDRVVVAVIGRNSSETPEVTYASPVTGLTMCFDAGRRFDVNMPDCPLEPTDPS
jgi:hypothetical protein